MSAAFVEAAHLGIVGPVDPSQHRTVLTWIVDDFAVRLERHVRANERAQRLLMHGGADRRAQALREAHDELGWRLFGITQMVGAMAEQDGCDDDGLVALAVILTVSRSAGHMGLAPEPTELSQAWYRFYDRVSAVMRNGDGGALVNQTFPSFNPYLGR